MTNTKTKLSPELQAVKDGFSIQALRFIYLESFSGRAHEAILVYDDEHEAKETEMAADYEALGELGTTQWQPLSSDVRGEINAIDGPDRYLIADSLTEDELRVGMDLFEDSVDPDIEADFDEAYAGLNDLSEAVFPAFDFLEKNAIAFGYAQAIEDLSRVLAEEDWSIKTLPEFLTQRGKIRFQGLKT